MGCKGKYAEWITEDSLIMIKGWARDGYSNVQIADRIGITPQTLCEWMNRFPSFSEAIKKGRAPVMEKIEDAFYSKCEWQEYEETREEIIKHPDGSETRKIVRVRHPMPPDTAALIFAMKNLKPHKWRDKPMDSSDKQNILDKAAEILKGVDSVVE